jgi:hypothetical protein
LTSEASCLAARIGNISVLGEVQTCFLRAQNETTAQSGFLCK